MPLAKKKVLSSLSLKVLLAYIVGVVLSITLITLLVYWLMTYQLGSLTAADLSALTEEMAGKLRFDKTGTPIGFDESAEEFAWIFESLRHEVAYRVLDANGNTILTSEAGEIFWPHQKISGSPSPGNFNFTRIESLIHGETVMFTHEGHRWFLQFAVSARFYLLMYQGFALPFMGVGIGAFSLVLLFVFGACAIVTLGYTFRPLRKISESAAAISPRSMHTRLDLKGVPSEISPLVESFNLALDRLEHGYRIQRDFMATAAHELKTPLALFRAQIEMTGEDRYRESLLDDVAHMARQVQQLLLLAEVSDKRNYTLTKLDVSKIVTEVVAYLKPLADNKSVRLTMSLQNYEGWLGDQSALFVLLKNLLENAIQHAPADTQVHIIIEKTTITVRDFGPGIEQKNLSHIFERFWRGPERRDHGAGLGLAICLEIALAHNWKLVAKKAYPGLKFCLLASEGT